MPQGPLQPHFSSTTSDVYDVTAARLAQQRDLLRHIAIGYQAAVRISQASFMSVTAPRADLSTLVADIESYATHERARSIAPEQVLARIKTVTRALSGQVSPLVAEALQGLVMRAFLGGYYGRAADGPIARESSTSRWVR